MKHGSASVPRSIGRRPGAQCIALLWLVLSSSATAQASSPNVQAVIERGQEFFDARNYDAALAEFTSAYSLLEGDPNRPAMLSNIALCHERKFRYDLALRFYEHYLREAGPDAQGRAAALASVARLQRLLVTLEIEANVAAEVWADSRRIGRAPGRIHLSAGEHVVELRALLYEPARREIALGVGESARVRFELTRLSEYSGLAPTYFWISGGLTLIAAGTGIAFGTSALTHRSEAEERRRQSPFLNTLADEAALRRQSMVADIAFASAGLLALGTLVLYFVTDFKRTAAGPDFAVALAPGLVRLETRRRF